MFSAAYAELNKLTESIKFASIILAAAPMLISYPFWQKSFEQGFMAGAVKAKIFPAACGGCRGKF